jgi:hypothetical protein
MARARRKKNSGHYLKSMFGSGLALLALLLIAAYALLGPTGIIAWTEYKQALNERTEELAQLEKRTRRVAQSAEAA